VNKAQEAKQTPKLKLKERRRRSVDREIERPCFIFAGCKIQQAISLFLLGSHYTRSKE
jgi:hypothetical protein